MLKRQAPTTIAVDLIIEGQGERVVVPVVFNNVTQSQIAEKNKDLSAKEAGVADPAWINREQFMFVVKTFNGSVPTHEGIMELEDNWPGAVVGVFYAFHEARRVEVRKN